MERRLTIPRCTWKRRSPRWEETGGFLCLCGPARVPCSRRRRPGRARLPCSRRRRPGRSARRAACPSRSARRPADPSRHACAGCAPAVVPVRLRAASPRRPRPPHFRQLRDASWLARATMPTLLASSHCCPRPLAGHREPSATAARTRLPLRAVVSRPSRHRPRHHPLSSRAAGSRRPPRGGLSGHHRSTVPPCARTPHAARSPAAVPACGIPGRYACLPNHRAAPPGRAFAGCCAHSRARSAPAAAPPAPLVLRSPD
jgi:hypothetical protein